MSDYDNHLGFGTEPLIEVCGDAFPISSTRGLKGYVNLDNAATTPPLKDVVATLLELTSVYGSVQRGAGIKSLVCTELYQEAIDTLRKFVGAANEDVVVSSSNTTTAINRLAMSYGFDASDVVLTSEIEHSSNDLPWRKYATVIRVKSTSDGRLDLDYLEDMMNSLGRRVRLIALTGASNVNGYLPPLREAARIAHRYGAEVFVDCAQLCAHRPISECVPILVGN